MGIIIMVAIHRIDLSNLTRTLIDLEISNLDSAQPEPQPRPRPQPQPRHRPRAYAASTQQTFNGPISTLASY